MAPIARPPQERFWDLVALDADLDACWEWRGHRNVRGYGRFRVSRDVTIYAHRFALVDAIGPIPEGLVVDHTCNNKGCVNPGHLEAVSQSENARRWNTGRFLTHCRRGHEFTAENTYTTPGTGRRTCRTCMMEWRAKHRPAAFRS